LEPTPLSPRKPDVPGVFGFSDGTLCSMKERRQNPIFMNFLLHHLPANAAKTI
jgi:hypothetical protein